MANELYYTSAPRGLRPLSSGFCTVGMTRGFPAPFISRIESLSGYRPPTEDADPQSCPAAYSHWIVEAGGVERHVLSVVQPTQPDHTKRSNKIAHHLLLKPDECIDAGPAWLLSQPGVMSPTWNGEPRLIDSERQLPRSGPVSRGPCETWEKVCGDAGWAGVIANHVMLDPSKSISIVYPEGADALKLVDEALNLLPREWRWRVTFTTYFMQPVAGVRCAWRFCLDGTDAATAARVSGATVDLCTHAPCTRTGVFINAARHGASEVEVAVAGGSKSVARAKSSGAASGARAHAPEKSQQAAHEPQLPECEFGVDLIDDAPTRRIGRPNTTLIVVIACALLLMGVAIIVGGMLPALQGGLTGGGKPLDTTTNSSANGAAGGGAAPTAPAGPSASDLAIDDLKNALNAEKNRAAVAEVQLDQSQQQVNQLKAEREDLDRQIADLKARLNATQQPPAIEPPVQPAVAPSIPSPSSTSLAPPTRKSDWQTFSLPEFKKGASGDWGGSRSLPMPGRVESVSWQIDEKSGVGGFSFAGGKVLVAGTSDEVARLEPSGQSVKVSWTATAAVANRISFNQKAVQRAIESVPFAASLEGGQSKWGMFQLVRSREVGSSPLDIENTIGSGPWEYCIGAGAWQDCSALKSIRVSVVKPTGVLQQSKDAELTEIGTITLAHAGNSLRLSFAIDPAFDPVELAAKVSEAQAKESNASAELRRANQQRPAVPTEVTRWTAEESDARIARETAVQQQVDAALLVGQLANWSMLVRATGGVPTELTVAPPKAPKSAKARGTSPVGKQP